MTLKELSPLVKAGEKLDKLVNVGALNWLALKQVRDAIRAADLPLPKLADESFRAELDALLSPRGAGMSGDGTTLGLPIAGIVKVALSFLASNAEVVFKWVLQHPEIVEPLVIGGSNLTLAEFEALPASQAVQVARAVLRETIDDGLLKEIGGFFGEWFSRLLVNQTQPKLDEQPSSSEPATLAA